MNDNIKIAEVVTNGKGKLFAQFAANREYTCWTLTDEDISRFGLRVYDEVEIVAHPQDQFCKVIERYEPE